MSKMVSRAFTIAGIAAVLAMAPTAGPASAAVGSVGLTQALVDSDDLVLVQQQRKKKGKGKRSSNPKISPEHQQRIRQNVPAEYHQYIPGLGGGGGGGAGAGGGVPR